MPNPYITQVPPYMQQDQGLSPVFQNIAQQQQNQNAALAQQNQQVQQAGHVQGSSGGISALNPALMAAMLRKENPYAQNKGDPYLNAQTAMNKYGAENVYGYGGQGQVPTSWNGEF